MAEGRGQGPRGGGDRSRDSRAGRGASGGRGGGAGIPGGTGSRGGGRPSASGGRPQGGARGPRAGGAGGRPSGERGAPRGARRDDARGGGPRERADAPRSEDQAKYDGPPLDPEITGKELDRSVAQQLRGLPEKLAARVARHLVAAGRLIDEDPRTAYEHTLAARVRAARIAVVREACGEAAYHAGEFAEALSELRAAKRMNGNTEYLAVMADCERALGRPEKALALTRNPAVVNFPDALKAEVTIVEAGARRDLGEIEGALRTLEHAPLRSQSRADWVARLRYAYADTLLAAGRREEAVEWFHRTVGVDGNQVTDAHERLAELEGSAEV